LFRYSFANKEENHFYIPIRGKGLWGPIWGFISLESDMNTVYGVSLVTKVKLLDLVPRLKRKNSNSIGKQIFDESGKFVSVTVLREVQNQMICMVLMLFREQQ
jgi:Na+-transporting NADH:ubiquinone oxidoreductase subunit C